MEIVLPNHETSHEGRVNSHLIYQPAENDTVRSHRCKVYATSWGLGTRLAVCGWLLVLIVPMCIAILSVEDSDVPDSLVGVCMGFSTAFCVYVLLCVFAAPSCVRWDSPTSFSLRVSPCNIQVLRMEVAEIKSSYRVSPGDIWRMRFSGFPTDWGRSLAIELKSGRKLIVSLKDPDGFIGQVNSFIP